MEKAERGASMFDSGKRIVYRYKGKSDASELELDSDGEIATPVVGSTITRHGKQWTVISVLRQQDASGPDPLPVLYVVLSDRADE